jgi:sulfonate transport system permease protein
MSLHLSVDERTSRLPPALRRMTVRALWRGNLPDRLRWSAPILYGLSAPLALLGVWAVAVHFEWLAPQILPAPSLVWQTSADLILSGNLPNELGVSLARLAAGLLAGGSLGIACGLLLGLSQTADDFLGPTIRTIFLVPSLGWLPFFMMVLGIGEGLKFALIAKTCFFPLMVEVAGAIRALPSKYGDVSRCMELNPLERLRHVILPAIVPAIAVGLRQALSKGWKALVLVEMISSASGIGYLMMWGRKSFQLDVVFATMIVIAGVGFLFDRSVSAVQSRIADWSLHDSA